MEVDDEGLDKPNNMTVLFDLQIASVIPEKRPARVVPGELQGPVSGVETPIEQGKLDGAPHRSSRRLLVFPTLAHEFPVPSKAHQLAFTPSTGVMWAHVGCSHLFTPPGSVF